MRVATMTSMMIWAAMASATLACGKHAPDELPPSDAGPLRTVSADGALLSGTVSANGPLNSPRAQSLGMQFAAQRWPQYHPRMATALHLGSYWRVVIEFQEPGVGAHVIVDSATGAVLDAGTSNGEH